MLEALAESRVRLKAAIARQTRLKRVPELSFRPDPAVREGTRIEAILAEIGPIADDVPVPDEEDHLDDLDDHLDDHPEDA